MLGAVGFGVFIKLTGLLTQPGITFRPCALRWCVAMPCVADASGRQDWRAGAGGGDADRFDFPVGVCGIALAADQWRPGGRGGGPERRRRDLVVVHPWYFGLTYGYYYRGAAKWTTLPPLADYRFHRYDLLKEELATTNAIAPVLTQLEAVLRAGHRVWIVGNISAPPSGAPVPAIRRWLLMVLWDGPISPNRGVGQ